MKTNMWVSSELYNPEAEQILIDDYDRLIGQMVQLPDGGKGKIEAVAVSGLFRRVEWCIAYWYQGSRYTIWLEPNEVTLVEQE